MTDFDVKLGEIFARLRTQHNYSQQYVADCMGVSKSTVHNWEKGKRQMFAHQFMELCAFYGVRPADIAEEIDNASIQRQ